MKIQIAVIQQIAHEKESTAAVQSCLRRAMLKVVNRSDVLGQRYFDFCLGKLTISELPVTCEKDQHPKKGVMTPNFH